jgi:hypothetical protein
MAVLEIRWNPSLRELRQFAALWIVFFSGIGAYLYYHYGAGTWPTVAWVVAAGVGLPGLTFPALLRPIYVGWMLAAFPIGWTISHLLLGSIFYLVITPLGLMLRLFGHDPMRRKFEPEAKTYWIEHARSETARYFRMY